MSAASEESCGDASMKHGSCSDYRKRCTLCNKLRNVLVRCQIDETGKWHFVCPGACWTNVSGGKIDGDGNDEHQWYRYGGMWKNKHEAVSAKKPKPSKKKAPAVSENRYHQRNDNDTQSADLSNWNSGRVKYTKNDKAVWNGVIWICRKSHESEPEKTPGKTYQLWKEEQGLVKDVD